MERVDAQIEELVKALKGLNEDDRAPLLEKITDLCRGPDGARARSHLESVARGQVLEIQWELEDSWPSTISRPAGVRATPSQVSQSWMQGTKSKCRCGVAGTKHG